MTSCKSEQSSTPSFAPGAKKTQSINLRATKTSEEYVVATTPGVHGGRANAVTGGRAMSNDEWTATPPPAPVFPRELRVWALNHYARFGTWPSPIADHAIPEDLGTAGMRARAFYLSTVRPVEEQATWSEWGLVSDVSPAPTFAPFVPGPRLV